MNKPNTRSQEPEPEEVEELEAYEYISEVSGHNSDRDLQNWLKF